MSVFCELIEDEKILSQISPDQVNILLIGCSSCMNESLAFTHRQPISKLQHSVNENDWQWVPYSTRKELERLKLFLEKNNKRVRCIESEDIKNISNKGILCIRKAADPFPLLTFFKDYIPDVLLVMSCSAGVHGIVDSYGKLIPIKKITKDIGYLCYIQEERNRTKQIVYKSAKIISGK